MKIRLGKEADISKLWGIERESAKAHQKIIPKSMQGIEPQATSEINKKDFIKFFKRDMKEEGNFFLVAEEDKKILGYLSVDLFYNSKNDKCWHIVELAVSREHTREGIGSKLLRDLARRAKDKNIFWISLNVKDKNNIAKKLYEKNKFKVYDIRMVKKIK